MYRTIDCDTWDDPWFAELPPDAKLLFLYCITNRRATAAGVFEITARAISFETGLTPAAVQSALTALVGKVVWYAEQQTIWVVNFYRRQRANSNGEKFAAGARKALRAFAPEVQRAVGDAYPELCDPTPPPLDPTPIPTPSHPNEYVMPPPWQGDKETVTGSETGESVAPAPAREVPPGTAVNRRPDAPRPVPKPGDDPAVVAFVDAELRPAYPLRNGKLRSPRDAYAAVATCPRQDWPALLVAAKHYAASDDGREGYAKDLDTWITSGEWREWLTGPGTPRPIRAGPATNGTPPGNRYTLIRRGDPP